MTPSKPLAGPFVFVFCPRCCGKGSGAWQPDAGICYLCRGQRCLEVDLARSERHLAFLRAEYRRARQEIRAMVARREDPALALEALGYLVEKGQNRRALHDAAVAAWAAVKDKRTDGGVGRAA